MQVGEMKNILIITAVSLSLSCASERQLRSSPSPAERTPRVSAIEYTKTCQVPDERYFIQQLNTKVFRHSNCMSIDDLLVVVWFGELTPAAKDGAAFLAIAYAARVTQSVPAGEYAVRPIGVDTLHYAGIDYHMSFFELRPRGVIK